MAQVLKEKIVASDKLAEGIYRLRVLSEEVALNAKPGQFVNVKCCEGLNAFLRRPISICDIDSTNKTFDIVFQVKGTGTSLLAQLQPGKKLDFLGPLGKPFDTSLKHGTIAVVGGGIGVFPLLYLLKELKGLRRLALLGFRNMEAVVLSNEFGNESELFEIATDDGSLGRKGLIGDVLEERLDKEKIDLIYTCGPAPMIKKVVELANRKEVKCQVSLEQRMGCGIGACLVCACKTRHGDDWEYSHVCKDGPVFWSDEVILD